MALACALCATQLIAAAPKGAMPVMRITIDGPVTATMPYTNGTMELTDTDGNITELKAKFQTRGATAKHYLMKPALNMKLRTDDYSASQDSSLLGIRSISSYILDAMAIDRICMRNRLAMDVWNAYSPLPYETDFAGRSGTEGRFVELYINGDLYGIYCLSDKINRKLLNLKKYDTKNSQVRGVLYKSGTEDIADQNQRNFTDDFKAATVQWHDAWELKEPEDYECMEAWQPLLDAYDKIKSYEQVCRYFDVDNLVDHQLLVMALSIMDNWGNKNHYMSIRDISKDIDDADPAEAAKRKFMVTPWDLDTSLGGHWNGDSFDGNYEEWPIDAPIRNGGFFPYHLCQGNADYNARLKARWQELRNGALSEEAINARLEDYRDLFINSGAWQRMVQAFEARADRPKYVTDLAGEVAHIEDWYAKRCKAMDQYFGTNGICDIAGDSAADSAIYTLQGVRLNEVPTTPGIYIRNGRKFFVP